MLQFLFEIIGWTIGELLGDFAAARGRDWRRRRLAQKGKVEAALRVRTGNQDGLSHKWHRSVLNVSRSALRYQTKLGRHLELTVVEFEMTPTRAMVPKELLFIDPNLKVYLLTTPTASIEMAVSEKGVGWLADQLRGPIEP